MAGIGDAYFTPVIQCRKMRRLPFEGLKFFSGKFP
jgi:hypothetical protein